MTGSMAGGIGGTGVEAALRRVMAVQPDLLVSFDALSDAFAGQTATLSERLRLQMADVLKELPARVDGTGAVTSATGGEGDTHEALALAFAKAVADDPLSIPEDLYSRLSSAFSPAQLVELFAWTSFSYGAVMFASLMGVEEGAPADAPLAGSISTRN